MENGLISNTILYYASLSVSGMGEWLFINIMLRVNLGLGIMVSSSPGLAVLTIPIFAPLVDTINIGREQIVNSYEFGFHLIQFVSPKGLLLACLTLAKVSFGA
jgi:uncharacterized ion transporter superfamily protein YfcC